MIAQRWDKNDEIQCRRHGTIVARYAAEGGVPGEVENRMRAPRGRHSFVTPPSTLGKLVMHREPVSTGGTLPQGRKPERHLLRDETTPIYHTALLRGARAALAG